MNQIWAEAHRIKQAVAKVAPFATKFNGGLSELLSKLSQELGRPIKKEELLGAYVDDRVLIDSDKKPEDSLMYSLRSGAYIELDSEDRIGKLLGKPVSEMSREELQEQGIRLLTIDQEEYTKLMTEKGFAGQTWVATYVIDGTFMLNAISKLHGVPYSSKDLEARLLQFGKAKVGIFAPAFEGMFSRSDWKDNGTLESVRQRFYEALHAYERDLKNHNTFDQSFKERHIISQPKLLEDRTIETAGESPLCIAFSNDGKTLYVLSQPPTEKGGGRSPLMLQSFDMQTGTRRGAVPTGLDVTYHGSIMGAELMGSLSVGTNEVIYVTSRGRVSRFDKNLKKIEGNEGRYKDALSVLAKNEIMDLHPGYIQPFQVVEADGVHYFALQPNDSSSYGNILVASDGTKLVGKPHEYSPDGGYSNTASKTTPELVISGNELLFKKDGKLVAADRSLTQDAIKNALALIEREKGIGNVPSNIAVDRQGLVWADTLLCGEELPSTKAYQRGKAEPLTHLYHALSGGFPVIRWRAVHDSLMAYTDFFDKKVHFYQLPK